MDANGQSHTPPDSPQKDTTPEKDKVPESDQMFVENEVNKEAGTPCGQVETNSPQDAKQACSISELAPGDTFYSSDGTSYLHDQPGKGALREVVRSVVDSTERVGPKKAKDLETGGGSLNIMVESVVKSTRKVRPRKPRKPKKVPKPHRLLLGKTYTLLPHETSAISLPDIPSEDSRVSDLDTRCPVDSLPLRRYPAHPNLNTLLIPCPDLQQTHQDNLHGRSKSGLNAGKFQYALVFD